MNEKLDKLLWKLGHSVYHNKEAEKLIQQYADEQALGFAKWCMGEAYQIDVETKDWWSYTEQSTLTNDEILTRYHESQKP